MVMFGRCIKIIVHINAIFVIVEHAVKIVSNLETVVKNKDEIIIYKDKTIKQQEKEIRKQKILKNLGFVGSVVLPVITLIILL